MMLLTRGKKMKKFEILSFTVKTSKSKKHVELDTESQKISEIDAVKCRSEKETENTRNKLPIAMKIGL